MHRWQLRDAKARFSDVVRCAAKEGPQTITLHGKPAAVVLSHADYEALIARTPRFIEFLRASPLVGVTLDIERDRSPVRDIEL